LLKVLSGQGKLGKSASGARKIAGVTRRVIGAKSGKSSKAVKQIVRSRRQPKAGWNPRRIPVSARRLHALVRYHPASAPPHRITQELRFYLPMVTTGATKKTLSGSARWFCKHGGAREKQIQHGMTVAPEENNKRVFQTNQSHWLMGMSSLWLSRGFLFSRPRCTDFSHTLSAVFASP
jgi:hypothetical protein